MDAKQKGFTEMLEACKRNDRKQQEVLYRYFFPRMLPMVRRHTQDDDEIVSIMNDGFLKIFRKIDKYSGKGSLEGWIRKLIYHSISDHFRSKKLKIKFLFDEVEDVPIYQNSKLEYEDMINMVLELPEKERKVFELHAIYGYTHPEISKMIQINENTSKWILANARKKLKEKLFKSNYIGRHAK